MRNRVWLALTGLSLLIAGAMAVAGGLGAFGREHAGRPLLTAVMSRWVSAHRWFWPSVAMAACAVALLGAGWLTAQVRCRTLRRLAMGDPGSGATRMAAQVATRAITTDVTCYPGVRRARARLLGSTRRPWIRVHVTCDDVADLVELERRIRDDAMVRLRTTLDRQDIGGIVDFRIIHAEPAQERRVG